MNPDDINKYYKSISYTYKGDEGWVQLTPETLAKLYTRRKKEVEENRHCMEYYLELAVEASEMKQANEVIKRIMSKN